MNFHTPRGGRLRDFLYNKGAEVRGVIAITEVDAEADVVVFMDLRQLAEGISFVTLDRPYVLIKDLPGYFSRRPPPSWVLRVEGGVRRGDRIEVQHGDTLALGFQYVPPESDSASPSNAPPPDDDSEDDDADDDPSDESGEDESAAEDSDTSTRSRSRHRHPHRAGRRGSSSDRSYQGNLDDTTFPFEGFRGWLGVPHGFTAPILHAANANVAIPSRAVWPMSGHGCEAMLRRIACLRQVFGVRFRPGDSKLTIDLCSELSSAMLGRHDLRAWVSRLLTEPIDTPGPGRSVIRDLAYVTGELGGRWPYFPLQPAPGAALPPLSDGSDEEAYATMTRTVVFVILTPDFTPERLSVEVAFPAVTADVLPLLQQARSPERQARFPYLAAALPQSCAGIGMYVAAPHWNPDAVVVIFDLLAVDGRLYAAITPSYVDRALLCDIADVPEAAALSFYVGISGEPLTGDAIAHLVQGIVVIVLPDHDPSPNAQVLQQMLLFPDMWRAGYDPQPQVTDGVYCLVHGHRHRRFITDFREPLRYRQQLARAVGAEGVSIHVAPAVPRVANAEIDGVPCHTAIAVQARGEHAWGRSCLVLVDCRALLEGWMSWPAYDGLILLEELLQALRFSVPPGWDVTVSGARAEGPHLHVEPGQVLVADYFRGHVPLPMARFGPYHGPVTGTPTLHEGDFLRLNAPTVEAAVSAWQRRLAENPLTGPADAVANASARSHNCQALVFAPEYLAELYELHVEFPQTLAAFIDQVAGRRCTGDCRRFPVVVPVFPQPDERFATFVAVPAWPATCLTVLVDARQVDGRLFAVGMPAKVDFASVLAIADFPATVEVQLYFRDMPWPVEHHTHLHVTTGDLFTIRPAHSEGPASVSLQVMLQSSDGWDVDDPFAYEPSRRLCIVTEVESFLHEVNLPRSTNLGEDLAAATGIARRNLLICPTLPHIWDHMDRGRMVRQVLLALERPAAADETTAVPFLLDLRPIQLGFQTAWAPAAGYDVAALARRLAGFCLDGFRVEVFLAHSQTHVTNALTVVGRGEVLCVEFVRQGSVAEATSAASPEIPLQESDGPQSPHISGDSLPSPTRDTGPAQPTLVQGRQPSSRHSGMQSWTCARIDKCHASLQRDSFQACVRRQAGLWLSCCLLGLLLIGQGAAGVLLVAQLCLLSPTRLHGRWLLVGGVLACALSSYIAEAVPIQHPTGAIVGETKGVRLVPEVRRIATPCRSLHKSLGPAESRLVPCAQSAAPVSSAEDSDIDRWYLRDLHTVLDDCAAASDEWALLAATLLDTLIEHREGVIASGCTETQRVVLALEPVVHVSAFQRQCLELQHLLPESIAELDQQTDWLDNDLTGVLHFRGATLAQRTAFANIKKWHDEYPRPSVLAVDVFTDGSASGHAAATDIAPAGWAFTVWLRAQGRCFFFGAASGTAVPPDTRYHLGETQDSPLQSELLALCWALAWITEYGRAFACPVHVHYDRHFWVITSCRAS